MKRFELWAYDKETERLKEMAAARARPSYLRTGSGKGNTQISKAKRDVGNKAAAIPKGSRLDVLIKQVKKGKLPFFVDVGKQKLEVEFLPITNKAQVIKQIEGAAQVNLSDTILNKRTDRYAYLMERIRFKTKSGEYRIYDVALNSIPGMDKMTAGRATAVNTTINQALQCVIAACLANNIEPLPKNTKQISQFVNISGITIKEALLTADLKWAESAEQTYAALKKYFGTNFKGYIFEEEDVGLKKRLWNHVKKLAAKDKVKIEGNDPNKWNAADMWIMSKKFKEGDLLAQTSLADLNDKMVELYDKRILIGVSLKGGKKGGMKLSVLQHPTESSKKSIPMYKFDNLEVESVVNSKDGMPNQNRSGINYLSRPLNGKIGVITFLCRSGGYSITAAEQSDGKTGNGQVHGESLVRLLSGFMKFPDINAMHNELKNAYETDDTSFWKNLFNNYKKLPKRNREIRGWKDIRNFAYYGNEQRGTPVGPLENALNKQGAYHPVKALFALSEFWKSWSKMSSEKKREALSLVYMHCVNDVDYASVAIQTKQDNRPPLRVKSSYSSTFKDVSDKVTSPAVRKKEAKEENAKEFELVAREIDKLWNKISKIVKTKDSAQGISYINTRADRWPYDPDLQKTREKAEELSNEMEDILLRGVKIDSDISKARKSTDTSTLKKLKNAYEKLLSDAEVSLDNLRSLKVDAEEQRAAAKERDRQEKAAAREEAKRLKAVSKKSPKAKKGAPLKKYSTASPKSKVAFKPARKHPDFFRWFQQQDKATQDAARPSVDTLTFDELKARFS